MKRVAAAGPRLTVRRAGVLLASLVALCLGAMAALGQDATDAPRPTAAVLTVDGPIGPATAGYITDEITRANDRGRDVIVLKMDTPGGLSASMREIIAAILASDVPVATYVAPRGARAASAGTYILYASHVAAMAPGTTLGAATPVQMGGDGGSPLPGGGQPQEPADDAPADGGDGSTGETGDADAPDAPMNAKKAKVLNDAIAYIRALAELRGRNVDWAEKAVREAATLTVDEAVAQNVADLKAANVAELLDAADGRTVKLGEREVTLTTANADLEDRAPDWRDRLLATITHPNIAFILMTIGIYGLIFELSNPGAIVPGVLGAICLMVGLYALNVLPVNYAGLALVGLGIALMTAEAFAPSFGVLGLGGLAAFGLGATILFDTGSDAFALSYWVIAGVTAATGAVLILLIGYLIRAQRGRVVTGARELIGAHARVESWSGGTGRVWLHSERWNARGPAELDPGQTVVVTALDGLTVTVAPTTQTAPPSTAGGPA
jgi:membrane-bound serine protease (ClpP class)